MHTPRNCRARSSDLVAHVLALGLLRAFLPQVLKVFARHHWTGLDIALDQQGGLEACHHLGSRTAKRFLAKFNAKPRKVLRAALPALADFGPDMPLPRAILDAPGADAAAAGADDDLRGEADRGEKDNEDDFVTKNNKRREAMEEFWITHGSPLWILIILRVLLEPLFFVSCSILSSR